MAKGLAQKMFPRGFYVDSAGIDSETSGGANFRAISVMGEYGVDLMNHLAKNITDVAISDFDHVIAMDSNVFDSVIKAYPEMERSDNTMADRGSVLWNGKDIQKMCRGNFPEPEGSRGHVWIVRVEHLSHLR